MTNEPISLTLFRIKTYFLEPYRFKLLDVGSLSGYDLFLLQQCALAKHRLEVDKVMENTSYKPLITVIIPVYNTAVHHLEICLGSVIGQWYSNVEILLYDDCSDSAETITALQKLASSDARIQLFRGAQNRHISYATNCAIKKASGEYIALVDHDDVLEPYALFEAVLAMNDANKPDLIYTDEDKIDQKGRRFGPYFKSDFDIDLLLSNNYINHLVIVKKSVGDTVGWFREGYEGAQDHDFLLRVAEQTKKIFHIPKVLYSWRIHPDSTAMSHDQKPYAVEAGRRAIEDYLTRNEIKGSVGFGPWQGAYRVVREIDKTALVSIIIPFKDLPELTIACVKSILTKTEYAAYEIILVNNNSNAQTIESLYEIRTDPRVKWHDFTMPFNFSAMNNETVHVAKGDYILFLNNDTEVINPDWLSEMVGLIVQPDVGAVGANLRYEDNTVQHQGVVLGIGGFAGHLFRHFPAEDCRHFSQGLVRQYSAVTGACLITKRSVFLAAGGFDEENLQVALNDVDYCLKVRELGYKVIYTPYAMLYHFESKSRGYEDNPAKVSRLKKEVDFFVAKWGQVVYEDPFYNKNLTLDREDMSLR